MTESNSYRQILRSTSILGGASIVNLLLVGVARLKIAALLLGPGGVGSIGVLTSFITTAAHVFTLGLNSAGTRQIAGASARDDPVEIRDIYSNLRLLCIALGVAGAATIIIVDLCIGHAALISAPRSAVIWAALGVGVTVFTAPQLAYLNGQRRIAELAKVTMAAGLTSTLASIIAMWAFGAAAVGFVVAAVPFATFLFGALAVRKNRTPHATAVALPSLAASRALIGLGTSFMIAGLAAPLGQLLTRAILQRELGGESLGYFQAAASVSTAYIGFALTAMGNDYYPRLTAVINEPKKVNQMVNEQAEVALLLAGPILLGTMACAPWLLTVLFSRKFEPAADVLRWFVLGDLLKVCSWPLGIVVIAAGDGKTLVSIEYAALGILIATAILLLPTIGLSGGGIAYCAMYATFFVIVYLLARRRTQFRFTKAAYNQIVYLTIAITAVFALATWNKFAAATSGLLCACILLVRAAVVLGRTAPPGSIWSRLSKKLSGTP